MKYNYQKLDVETYIESLYADGIQQSNKLSANELKETILNIGIFKFKGYVKAFRSGLHQYTFDDLIALYETDRKISSRFFILTSKIEIKLKSYLIELIYELTDNPFFYLLKENYIGDFSFNFESIRDWEVKNPHPQQKPEIYQHYRDYYLAKYTFSDNAQVYLEDKECIELNKDKDINYPPFHYFVENMTLGTFINMISKLSIDDNKILNLLGKRFNIKDSKLFLHYLLRLKELRNRSAHNGRIFNRNYRGVRGFEKHKNYRQTIYEHKLIDVYYTLSYLLEGKDTFRTTENLVEKFKAEILSDCEQYLSKFMINIMKTR